MRSTARVLQFIEICKKSLPSAVALPIELISRANTLWLLQSQKDTFATEISDIKKNRSLPKSSNVRKLTPYLDQDGLLRAEGRISETTNVPDTIKNPIILSGNHTFVKLIIKKYHVKFHHGNNDTVINEIRQKLWVTKLRATLKSVVNNCQFCRVKRALPQQPRMGNLPRARLAHHHRPFSYCGMDYFGPMTVTIGRRHEKRWGVLFTCLTTRAVHIELAASLSTDSAIMALRRMTARRGQPLEIYSDNGTNLRGAATELRAAIRNMNEPELYDHAANIGVTWKFIPPAAPHMGGSWERLVQSIKRALKVTLTSQSPKEEVLLTLMAEAEYTVNCRPLTHIPVSVTDPEALTPNHFLLGSSVGNPCAGKFDQGSLCSRKQWQCA